MTDNRPQRGRSATAGACARARTRGLAYVSHACRAAGLKHKRTRPYTPRTNGKAERFIQISLREWALPASLHELGRTDRGHAPLAARLQPLAAPLGLGRQATRLPPDWGQPP